MNKMNKRLTTSIIILVLTVSLASLYLFKKNMDRNKEALEAPKMPAVHYVRGMVETIAGDTYTVLREDVRIKQDFTLSPEVLVHRRSTDKTGSAHPITQLSEVKVGSLLVVYYEIEKTGEEKPKITSIDIIK